MDTVNSQERRRDSAPETLVRTIDPTKIASPTIKRLLEEVKNAEECGGFGPYDRCHNKHNR